jgi:alpha-L-arabinofuranosidase
VVALLRPLDIGMLRFPGGIAADFYDWKKGVGPSRGELRNPFDKKMEKVEFGSPEFVALARQLNARACITANYGTGTPADAAAWATWFQQQGFVPECWEVGNEIYLSGPRATGPNSREIYKPGAQYAKDFPAFASAIKGVIPEARVGAIAHLDTGAFPLADGGNPNWTRDMLSALTARADFFALHNGYAPVVIDDSIDLSREADRQKMYRAMFAAPLQTRDNLAAVASEIQRRSPVNASAPFAITEFGTLIGISGNPKRHLAYVDHTRTQAAALYVASVLDVYMGDPRVMMTMYTNPVHRYYGNLILADPGGLVTSPTYFLYRFYADRFEPRIVGTQTSSPSFSAPRVGVVKARSDVPSLLARASKSSDGRRLTALLVNRSLDAPLETDVALEDFVPGRTSCEILAAPAPNAINGPGLTETVVAKSGLKPQPFPCKNAASQRLSLPPGSILSLVVDAS